MHGLIHQFSLKNRFPYLCYDNGRGWITQKTGYTPELGPQRSETTSDCERGTKELDTVGDNHVVVVVDDEHGVEQVHKTDALKENFKHISISSSSYL